MALRSFGAARSSLLYLAPKPIAPTRIEELPPQVVTRLLIAAVPGAPHLSGATGYNYFVGDGCWGQSPIVHAAPIHPDNADRDFDRLVHPQPAPQVRSPGHPASIPIKDVSESLGHADTATTVRTYAHVLPVQHAELDERIGALLFRGSSEAT
jgi:hypothetical protein